jgi:hypothetical protein
MSTREVMEIAGLRRALSCALVVLLAMMLASCETGGGSQPFAKLDSGPKGKTVPPIFLIEVTGLPAGKLQSLKDALSYASGKRDMAIVEGKFEGNGFALSGKFQILPDPASVRLAYNWTLTDKAGTVLHTVASEETASGAAGPDPWTLVTPAVLERVATYTAESLSNRLAQMGYATQLGGLPPPLEIYAMAGPNADHEIDYETVYGPGKALPVSALVNKPNGISGLPPEPEASPGSPDTKQENGNRNAIRAVAVTGVRGASASGNAELTAAMREALASAGWPVVNRPRDDALTVSGQVNLGNKEGDSQKVALAWTVASPDGQTLGTIKQANSVPSGSLDQSWGDTAVYAAQAGATGIFDLVKKLR